MIKTYEAMFDENGVEDGVFGISLVKSPAMQGMFIALSEQEKEEVKKHSIQFKTVDEEKRMLIGLVLEPDKLVPRRTDLGEEFNIVFKDDTIEKVAYNFFKQNHHKNSTIEHNKEDIIKGVTFVESWLVRDPKKDIGAHYGMDNPKGSWLVGMKVDSDEVWNDYIKTGKVQGFSIDAVVKLREVKTDDKSNLEMSKIIETLKETSDKLMVALKLKEQETTTALKFGEIKMEGGDVVFMYEGEELVAGINIFAVDPQDAENKIPVPVGNYPLEDGKILVVTEDGIVGEIKDAEQGEPDPNAEPPKKEDVQAGDSEAIQKIQSILIKYEARFEKLDALEKGLDEIRAQVLEFAEAPKTAPRTTRGTTTPLTREGRMLEQLRNSKN